MLTRTARTVLAVALLVLSSPSSAATLEEFERLNDTQVAALSFPDKLAYAEAIVAEIRRLSDAAQGSRWSSLAKGLRVSAAMSSRKLEEMKADEPNGGSEFALLQIYLHDARVLIQLSGATLVVVADADGADDTIPNPRVASP